jgi:hypothetical protein
VGGWLIPLGVGMVVALVAFVAASRLSLKVKPGGNFDAPPTKETLNEETDVKSFLKRASDKAQGARSMTWWKQLPQRIKALIALSFAAILLVFVSASLLLRPHDLSCSSKEAQELVFQIARDNGAMMDTATWAFMDKNPQPRPPRPPQMPAPPKSAERIAAEGAVAALDDAASRANKKMFDACVSHMTSGGNCIAAADRFQQARDDAATAHASLHAAYDAADAAARDAARAAAGAADAAARAADDAERAAASAAVMKEMKYTLDAIRTPDKTLSGALTCAATLKGDAGKSGAWTLPITYKVEQTSDGRLYVGVYGLTK